MNKLKPCPYCGFEKPELRGCNKGPKRWAEIKCLECKLIFKATDELEYEGIVCEMLVINWNKLYDKLCSQ